MNNKNNSKMDKQNIVKDNSEPTLQSEKGVGGVCRLQWIECAQPIPVIHGNRKSTYRNSNPQTGEPEFILILHNNNTLSITPVFEGVASDSDTVYVSILNVVCWKLLENTPDLSQTIYKEGE